MPKFIVTEITEIRTSYVVETNNAPSAIRKIRKAEYNFSPKQSVEQHFKAEEIKEEEN